jgi:ABC-type multidrug transport system permease subunit
MFKSDGFFYILAVLLGLSAGLLEITVSDLLATALFVMICTMVLGFIRPRSPWRWILIIGGLVPVVRLLAYLVMTERASRAQLWESGLGLLTGTAGAYCGMFARKAVDELFRPNQSR